MNEYEATEQAYKNGYRDGLLQGVKDCSAEIKRLKVIEEAHKELNGELRKEVERLKHKCEDCAGCTAWKCDCANERAEAIKEFAERLKADISNYWLEMYMNGLKGTMRTREITCECVEEYIDQIAKEMGVEL